MRASTLVLGPLVARCGTARVSLPGGCAIGARPIDLHIKGLEQLGAKITQDHGYIEATRRPAQGRRDRLRQDHRHRHRRPDDGRRARRRRNRAARMRPRAGSRGPRRPAEQDGRADRRRRHFHDSRQGVEQLHGAEHPIIPDRIEAGTFIIAGAITGGDLNVTGCDPDHLGALLAKLHECGVKTAHIRGLGARHGRRPAQGRRHHHRRVSRLPHRHAGAVHGADDAGRRNSIITENIFENRFMHAQELVRMGANIRIEGRRAIVRGKTPLSARRGDGFRPARLGVAGAGRAGRRRRDHHRPRLPHRPRLREHRRETCSGVGAQIRRIGEILPKRAAAPARV